MPKWVLAGVLVAIVVATVWFTDTAARGAVHRANREHEQAMSLYRVSPTVTHNLLLGPEPVAPKPVPPDLQHVSNMVWRVGGGIVFLEITAGAAAFVILKRADVLT